jgi:hypothetical protein
LFQDGFPNNLRDDVSKVVSLIPIKTYSNVSIGTSEQSIQYFQDGEQIKFPDRMYYINASDEVLNKLELQQKMIWHCICTRSCDGYVIEILEMAYDILKEQDAKRMK